MKKMKWLVGLIGIASLVPVAALAGLNPASPGLPSATYRDAAGTSVKAGIPNNGFSSMCVDCHTLNPMAGATRPGSHFVALSPDNNSTNSGGGWGTAGTDSQSGARKNGAYFKVSAWPSGAYSKYGDQSNDNSYSGTSTGNHTGAVDNTATNYAARDIICESCHNILVNAAGGNNLVNEPLAQTAVNAESVASATTYNVCVGCHGDMYSDSATNASVNTTKYGYGRNTNEVSATAAKKGVNTIHTISGTVYNMNHHVTTGDVVNSTLVGAGLAWRDTLAIDVALSPVGNGVRAGMQMPSNVWSDGKVKPGTAVNCLNCHTAGHSGSAYTAASILRDGGGGGTLRAAAPAGNGIARLGESGRSWMDINDVAYCNDCHQLAAGR